MNKKKYFDIMPSILLGILIAFTMTTNVFAKVTSYVVKDGEKIIRFDQEKLIKDYTNKMLGDLSPMFDAYIKHVSGLYGFEDDVKGLVKFEVVSDAYTDAMLDGKETDFKMDTVTESVKSEDILNAIINYEWKDGKIIPIEKSVDVDDTFEVIEIY